MCFSLSWVENVLIWLVVLGAFVAIMKILLPLVLGAFGWAGDTLMRIINIIIVAVIVIFLIIFAFDLLSCLGGGGFSLQRR